MSCAKRSMIGVALLWLACATPLSARAAGLTLPADGWASWQVPAVDGTPAWCCAGTCKLDGGRDRFSMRSDDATTDSVKVYARVSGGKVDSLQVYAASCPVEAKTPVHELADVAPDDSARWLIERAQQDGSDAVAHRAIGEGALTALAMHRGDLARNAMANFARQDARADTRKHAVLWLGLVRGAEVESERVLEEAVRKDPEEHVREQAVFALSRLPGERATQALIKIAEDQSLSREERKRAVFWLSQSDSDAAQAYLEKVLTVRAAR